jgi:hypothetical protein
MYVLFAVLPFQPTHNKEMNYILQTTFVLLQILKMVSSPARGKVFGGAGGEKRTALGSVDPNTPTREKYVDHLLSSCNLHALSFLTWQNKYTTRPLGAFSPTLPSPPASHACTCTLHHTHARTHAHTHTHTHTHNTHAHTHTHTHTLSPSPCIPDSPLTKDYAQSRLYRAKKKKRKSMGRRVSFAPGKQLDEIRCVLICDPLSRCRKVCNHIILILISFRWWWMTPLLLCCSSDTLFRVGQLELLPVCFIMG